MRQKGAILILTALALPLFIAGTGLAVDLGNMYVHKARLQNSTDAAVIAGGYQYAENESTTDTYDKIDEYMVLNQNTNPYTIDDVKYKTYDDDSIKITLTASEEVPLYFLKAIIDKDAGTVTAKSTAKLAPNGGGVPKMFEYAMIGGYTGHPEDDGSWDRMGGMNNIKNALVLHTAPVNIKGKVHSNGGVYLDISDTKDGNYYVYADEFTNSYSSDDELWSNYKDNYFDHYITTNDGIGEDVASNIQTGHENDKKIKGGNNTNKYGDNWRWYARIGSTKHEDFTAEDTNTGVIDIGMYNNKSNPMNESLRQQILDYAQQLKDNKESALKSFESQGLYVDTDCDFEGSGNGRDYQLNASSNTSSYPGLTCGSFENTFDPSWTIWSANYKTVIVDGNIIANIPSGVKPDNDDDHLMFVSLHGNIQLTNASPFYGYVYAPNGTVWIDGTYPIYGSIVAKSIMVTTGGQAIEAANKIYQTSGSTSKGGSYTVSLSDDD